MHKILLIAAALLVAGCTTPFITDPGVAAGRFACAFAKDPLLNSLGDAKVVKLMEEGREAEAAALSVTMTTGRLQRDEICASIEASPF